MYTKTYITNEGIAAKALLVHKKPRDSKVTLLQINAVTKAVISRIPLTCHELSESASTGFKSPSNNIYCQVATNKNLHSLRCDIMILNKSSIPPKPPTCEDDWGQGFIIQNVSKSGQRICYTDTVKDEKLVVLPYGKTWNHHSFICKSEKEGLSCRNQKGHGFILSKDLQKLF